MVRVPMFRDAAMSMVMLAVALLVTPVQFQENTMKQPEMPLKWAEYSDIATLIENLPPWGSRDFTKEEWQKYLTLADALQSLDDESMERVFLIYLDRAWTKHGRASRPEVYTQPMILLRLMFSASPELFSAVSGDGVRGALQARGVSIMGRDVWFKPFDKNADRTMVSASHPVAFDEAGPRLLGAIESGIPGSGLSRPGYQIHLEYRAFREMYTPRDLKPFVEVRKEWQWLVAEHAEAGGE